MSNRNRLKRLSRSVRTLPEVIAVRADEESDAGQLAREAAQSFADELDKYRRARNPDRPDPRERPPDWQTKAAMDCPPEDVTFADIERLEQSDPGRGMARWREVRAAACRDLDSGWLAARALEYMGGSAWERASFLAIRDRLRESWPPRNDGESILIDEMAQYELIRRQWIAILSLQSREPQTIIDLRRRDEPKRDRRRLGAADATIAAARMVDRLQRLYQNALRTLLSLRRTRGLFIVQRSGQVNVAVGPQLNLSSQPAEAVDEVAPENGTPT